MSKTKSTIAFSKDNVQKRRAEFNLTQSELSEKIDVALKTYQQWEAGKQVPGIEKAYKVAEVLECDIDYLFGRQSLPTKEASKVADLTGLSRSAIYELARIANYSRYDPKIFKRETISLQFLDSLLSLPLSKICPNDPGNDGGDIPVIIAIAGIIKDTQEWPEIQGKKPGEKVDAFTLKLMDGERRRLEQRLSYFVEYITTHAEVLQ